MLVGVGRCGAGDGWVGGGVCGDGGCGVTGLQVAVILSLGLLRPSLGLWKAWGGQGTVWGGGSGLPRPPFSFHFGSSYDFYYAFNAKPSPPAMEGCTKEPSKQ